MSAAGSPAVAGTTALAAVYLEHGKLHVARILSCGSKNCRIAAADGVRRLAVSRILAQAPVAQVQALAVRAQKLAAGLQADKLWELAGETQQTTSSLAQLAFGSAAQDGELAVRSALAADPAYFRSAGDEHKPVAAAQAAAISAGRALRKRAQIREREMFANLERGKISDEFASCSRDFVAGKHDSNSEQFRILRKFSTASKTSIPVLAVRWGLFADALELHMHAAESSLPAACAGDDEVPMPDLEHLPLLGDEAFSIDGAGTKEIDDAFTVIDLGSDRWQIGIHIAAPALGLSDYAQAQAQQRMTTMYLPDRKHMQLPAKSVEAYSLAAGCERASVSLLFDFNAKTGLINSSRFAVGKVRITANLAIDQFVGWQPGDPGPCSSQLACLAHLCEHLPAGRKKKMVDHSFIVSAASSTDSPQILARSKVAGIDALIAALMVFYNRAAADFLSGSDAAHLLRHEGRSVVQSGSAASSKEGCYAWASSPLRRYIDLCNQKQLIALLTGSTPPHQATDLRTIANRFEKRQAIARQFQQRLEHYWALRWLASRRHQQLPATVDGNARKAVLDDAPASVRIPAHSAKPGSAIKVVVTDIDLCELVAHGEVA